MDKLASTIATCGEIGWYRGAPGTYGSAAAFAPAIILLFMGPVAFVIGALAIIAIGTWAARHYAADMPDGDPQEVIIDEVAGQMIALAALAFGFVDFSLFNLLAAFILFRAFDIIKPFPIGWLDKNIKGGVGIMADDIAAGLCAFAVLTAFGLLL